MRFEASVFTGGRIEIDGNEFVRCRFDGTKLVFKGLAPVTMVQAEFNNVEWVFDGPAANTLFFLRSVYHGLGDSGRQLVERTFEMIRQAPPAPRPLTEQPVGPTPQAPAPIARSEP